MTAGNKGSYWLGAGGILDNGPAPIEQYPGTDTYTAFSYTTPNEYSGPKDVAFTLSGNSTDIYVPHLLWAAPYSLDAAFPSGTYRAAQWAYVGTNQAISL